MSSSRLLLAVASVLCCVLASASETKLPSAELTRYISAIGIEHLTLRCFSDRTSVEGYSCEVVQQRNGVVLASAVLEPKKVGEILTRYFQRTPKERIELASQNDGPSGRGDLTWTVTYGAFSSRGSHDRGTLRNQSAMIAVLALENELSTIFLK